MNKRIVNSKGGLWGVFFVSTFLTVSAIVIEMKKILYAIIGLGIIFMIIGYFSGKPSKEDTSQYEDTSRYDNANSEQKACVKTLGKGVYKDKSLEWKLDSCNVPK